MLIHKEQPLREKQQSSQFRRTFTEHQQLADDGDPAPLDVQALPQKVEDAKKGSTRWREAS